MVATAYGTDFIDVPDQKRVYITQTGGPHSFRPIYMDGRAHPKDLDPSYYGHSTGRWDGDTLVVDTVGFNEGFWFSRGIPHTDSLHMIEKLTRTDMNNTKYEVTIDDTGAYTQPWTARLRRSDQTYRDIARTPVAARPRRNTAAIHWAAAW